MEARLYAHEHSIIKCYTSSRLPVKLVYIAEFPTRDDAFRAERQIKGWSRRKKEALIKGDWEKLVEYSRSHSSSPSTGSG
jgi:putative endonuclease